MGLLKQKKSIEELEEDLEKVKVGLEDASNMDESEVEKLVDDEMEKRMNNGIDERDALDGVVRKLRSELSYERMSSAETFDGYVIGDKGVYDRTRNMRKEALTAFENDKGDAIKRGIVDVTSEGEPIPLDTREQMFGRDNPNYGKPLKNEWRRGIYGIAKKRPEGMPKIFHLTLRDNVALNEKPSLFEPVSFRANVRQDSEEMLLNHSNRTKFRSLSPDKLPDIEDILKTDILEKYETELANLNEQVTKCNNNWQYFVIAVADVYYIDPNTYNRGTRRISIWDESLGEEETSTVWIPGHIDMDFGQGSRIVVTGNVSESSYRGQTNYNINGHGIYAIPEYRTEPESADDEGDE